MKSNRRIQSGRRPAVERYWRAGLSLPEKIAWSALVPLALLYQAATLMRSGFWRASGLRQKAAGVRVISVGNLTVGGNAKTPFTLYLARKLSEQGLRTGIVSRGFGGTLGGGAAALVSDGRIVRLSVEEGGDEAVMMARAFDGPVAIARRRIDAIALLKTLGPIDAVVLDDAFQHLRLARDLDLLLISAERGLGNGWMLPAGPMREGFAALARADAAIVLGADFAAQTTLTSAQSARLRRIPVLRGVLAPRAVVYAGPDGWREAPAQSLGGRRVLALSALADPRSFYTMLTDLEADLVGVLEYPDHHRYTSADWQNIRRACLATDLVVTTEKDLVKLERFPFARGSLAALRLEISMGADEQRLLAMAMGVDQPPKRVVTAMKGGASSGA